MYSEEGGSRCARKRVHLFSLPGLRDGSKNEKLRVLENGETGEGIHIQCIVKNVGFFGSTITRIYDENIKTKRTRIMKCLAFFPGLDEFSFSFVFFLENKTNTRAMELGG